MISEMSCFSKPLMHSVSLEEYLPCPIGELESSLVLPGDSIIREEGLMAGSGTRVQGSDIVSTVVGRV